MTRNDFGAQSALSQASRDQRAKPSGNRLRPVMMNFIPVRPDYIACSLELLVFACQLVT